MILAFAPACRTGKRRVLQNLSQELRNCFAHAEDCAQRARNEPDPNLRRDFLDMERRWLRLAQSMELVDRLNAFPNPARKPPLHEYRLYVLGSDGHAVGPGMPIHCENDESAIGAAKARVAGHTESMLCDGNRIVKRFEHQGSP